jgi:FLYWCH zinc finger domain
VYHLSEGDGLQIHTGDPLTFQPKRKVSCKAATYVIYESVEGTMEITPKKAIKPEKCVDNVQLKLVAGQRGRSLLEYDGYLFSQNNIVGDTVYWCCRSRGDYSRDPCNARLMTVKKPNDLYKIVVKKPFHNHKPTNRMVKKLERSSN